MEDSLIKPEPKLKDRIELGDTEKIVLQTNREYGNTDSIWDILDILAERIDNRHINKESQMNFYQWMEKSDAWAEREGWIDWIITG